MTQGESTAPVAALAEIGVARLMTSFDGAGDLSLTVTQTNRHLTGIWTLFFPDLGAGEGGNLVGHVRPNGSVSVKLKRQGACKIKALGLVVSLDPVNGEISGTYLACHQDSGTFDILRSRSPVGSIDSGPKAY